MYLEKIAVGCLNRLEAQGLRLRLVSDPEAAAELLDRTDRDFSTFPLDGQRVAFTRTNAFWLFAMEGEKVFAGCGVRLDDLGGEEFGPYYLRTSVPTFGQPAYVIGDGFPADTLTGRVAYCGDLVSPKASSKGLAANNMLRLFCFYMQYRIFTDLRSDWVYCVMRDRQFARGAPQSYGFLSNLPFCWDWKECPYPGGRPEWISFLKCSDIGRLAASVSGLLDN